MQSTILHISIRTIILILSIIVSRLVVWTFEFNFTPFLISITIAIISGIPLYSRRFQLHDQIKNTLSNRVYFVSLEIFHVMLVFASIYVTFQDLGNIDLVSVFLTDLQPSQTSESFNILILFVFIISTSIPSAIVGAFAGTIASKKEKTNWVLRKLFLIRELPRSEIDSWIFHEL